MTNNADKFKPHLKEDRVGVISEIAQELGRIVRKHLDECTKCCPNCDNFSEIKELCRLNLKRPPAKVIAFGCEMYVDKIPF